jgi:CRISPR-associated exonuclease Cas4
MHITGTHINYYFSCHRQLWLFANSIQMEHTNDAVTEGKLIHETSYPQRTSKYEEIAIDGIKVDFYDAKKKLIHEIKKSPKLHDAHIWQVKYYIYVMEKNGIEGVSGVLEYPKERKIEKVFLSAVDREEIELMQQEIERIIHRDQVPELEKKSRCKNCSYYDFCFVGE